MLQQSQILNNKKKIDIDYKPAKSRYRDVKLEWKKKERYFSIIATNWWSLKELLTAIYKCTAIENGDFNISLK